MAILYGTTADGDSLPVEVNEFGQLVAQGLQGPEGPPGPPGVGQLPPDPFEGALLGWKDNTLAWLGGSAPVPEGTYGPIVAYENGVLTLETAVSLPYLTRINLTDAQGSPLFFSYPTSPIVNVVSKDIPTTFDQVFNPADDASIPNKTSVANGQRFLVSDLFAKYTDDSLNVSAEDLIPGLVFLWRIWKSDSPDGPTTSGSGFNSTETFSIERWKNGYFTSEYATCALYTAFPASPGDVVAQGVIGSSFSDVLTFVDASNFNRFSVGDVVQAPDVTILSISPETAQITTTPGNWSGTDGSGTVGGETRVYTAGVTGTGTVQSCVGENIVLREDNTHWAIGGYVTAPDQTLAVRYVYSDELKKKFL